jgi:hypothetical protein
VETTLCSLSEDFENLRDNGGFYKQFYKSLSQGFAKEFWRILAGFRIIGNIFPNFSENNKNIFFIINLYKIRRFSCENCHS